MDSARGHASVVGWQPDLEWDPTLHGDSGRRLPDGQTGARESPFLGSPRTIATHNQSRVKTEVDPTPTSCSKPARSRLVAV